MTCDALDPLIEAVADGSQPIDPAIASHLAGCERCTAQLAAARAIDGLLSMREVPVPPPAFTPAVMARVGQARWRTERAIDLGFNLAMAAGLLIILAGGAGLAWSLGFLTIGIDSDAMWAFIGSDVTARVLSEVQTLVMSAALLTTALVLWWWVETAAD